MPHLLHITENNHALHVLRRMPELDERQGDVQTTGYYLLDVEQNPPRVWYVLGRHRSKPDVWAVIPVPQDHEVYKRALGIVRAPTQRDEPDEAAEVLERLPSPPALRRLFRKGEFRVLILAPPGLFGRDTDPAARIEEVYQVLDQCVLSSGLMEHIRAVVVDEAVTVRPLQHRPYHLVVLPDRTGPEAARIQNIVRVYAQAVHGAWLVYPFGNAEFIQAVMAIGLPLKKADPLRRAVLYQPSVAAFVHRTGGVGKTTLAALLAGWAAPHAYVLYIDVEGAIPPALHMDNLAMTDAMRMVFDEYPRVPGVPNIAVVTADRTWGLPPQSVRDWFQNLFAQGVRLVVIDGQTARNQMSFLLPHSTHVFIPDDGRETLRGSTLESLNTVVSQVAPHIQNPWEFPSVLVVFNRFSDTRGQEHRMVEIASRMDTLFVHHFPHTPENLPAIREHCLRSLQIPHLGDGLNLGGLFKNPPGKSKPLREAVFGV